MANILRKFGGWFVPKISWITWNGLRALFNGGVFYRLNEEDWEFLRTALAKDHYIILTRNDSHFSTYLVSLGNVITTGKFSHWGHALMNTEGDNTIGNIGFKLMEATSSGVHCSTFQEVFRCDSVALLKPKNMTIEDWTAVFEKLLKQDGKKYDDLFDLADDQQLSCVELVRTALQSLPDYSIMFANLEEMIVKYGNLTPEMYYTCTDFEVVWERRR